MGYPDYPARVFFFENMPIMVMPFKRKSGK